MLGLRRLLDERRLLESQSPQLVSRRLKELDGRAVRPEPSDRVEETEREGRETVGLRGRRHRRLVAETRQDEDGLGLRIEQPGQPGGRRVERREPADVRAHGIERDGLEMAERAEDLETRRRDALVPA